jgi:hypothetical protein
MKMQTAFLEVVIPPDIIYEETSGGEWILVFSSLNKKTTKLMISIQDMMVPEGGQAKLVCKARGWVNLKS